MRVFSFGLFLQRINLMNLKSVPVQLVLSTLVINVLLESYFMLVYAYAHDTVFNTCFLYSCLSLHVCYLDSKFSADFLISLHVYWIMPVLECLNHISWSCIHLPACVRHLALILPLAGLLSDNSGLACPDPRVWNLWILPVADQSGTTKEWIIGRLSRALFLLTPLAQFSRSPVIAREYLLYCSYLYIYL